MASAAPLPTEIHRVVIVLDGSRFRGMSPEAREKRYSRYMQLIRALAKRHGARVHAREIHLKQSEIDKRKRAMSGGRRAGRRRRKRGS